jgi:Kdo2-lipid IVA lauroyltransferase/acyltransferase
MKRAVWLIEAGLSIILSIPIAVLPLQWALKAGEVLGLLLFYLWGSRRRIAIENLEKTVAIHSLIIPEPGETIIRNTFKNLGRSLAEIIKIYFGSGRKIMDAVHIEGIEHLHAARAKGKGVLLITGHCGNWELLALSASAVLFPISIVARPINNPYINKFVERARKKYGNSIIYKKNALKPIMQGLKNNDCIGILMDQAVIPEEGYVIDFLGRGAWTTKMPALIARKTGATAIPAFIHRENHGHKIRVYPAVELSGDVDKENALKTDTEKFSSFIEGYIREHPDEWLWIHRRWKRVNH